MSKRPVRNGFHQWWQQFAISADEVRTRLRRSAREQALWNPQSSRLTVLEPRLLYSATPIDPAIASDADESAMVEPADTQSNADSSESSSSDSTQSQAQLAKEIVIIDASVPHLNQLLDDLSQADRDVDVYVLDDSQDGIDQITEILDGRSDVDSIHLVSHAQDGAVKIGSVWLSEDNLDGYAGQIASWQGALSSEADLLIYGCDLAETENGQTLIDSLAALTGSDVAASTNDTGHANLGGDWDLEYQVGVIETNVAFSGNLQSQWDAVLATPELANRQEFLVNNQATGDQTTAGSRQAIASDDLGNYIVVWSDDSSGNWDVLAQRYDYAGNQVGNEFQVNATSSGDQNNASVAMNASGQFVVTFVGDDGSNDGILMRRFNADGTAVDANDIVVNVDHLNAFQSDPTVTINDSGQIVVAWASGGAHAGIFANAFDFSTTTDVSDHLTSNSFNVDGSSTSARPSIDINNSGRYVVTWIDNGDIFGRRYDHASSTAISGKNDLNVYDDTTNASIAVRADGGFVVAYDSSTTFGKGVWARTFDSDVNAGSLERVTTDADASDPSISMGSNGEFVVAYQTDTSGDVELFARKYNADSSSNGSAFQVNQTTTGDQVSTSITTSDGQNFAIAWSGNGQQTNNADGAGVFVRQFGSATAHTVTVTTTSDVDDGDTTSIAALLEDRGADGEISLREAIEAANSTTNDTLPDRINFNILGVGPHIISLGSALPNIDQAVIIDGTSEPDFSGTPTIVLNGASAGGNKDGISLKNGSDGSTIKGLVIQGFDGSGIHIDSSSNTIVGNYIGTDVSGQTGVTNNKSGIHLHNTASSNTIGGADSASRNIISGNTEYGILIEGGGSSSNVIINNYIGVSVQGDAVLGNLLSGIRIEGGSNANTIGGIGLGNVISGNQYGVQITGSSSSNNSVLGNWIGTDETETSTVLGNTLAGIQVSNAASMNAIGGASAGQGNVIGGNGGAGIEMYGSSTSLNNVRGNYIGTNSSESQAIGNTADGVTIHSGASNNTIGGRTAGLGNVISNNGASGIFVTDSSSDSNTLVGNRIKANGGLGIAIDSAAVNTNDATDGDTGANNQQNYPTVTSATLSGSNLTVFFSLHSSANTAFTIDFYSVASGDGSGHGESDQYLGSTTVTTNSSGDVSTDFTIASAGVSIGEFVTVTATDTNGNTSEFSQNQAITAVNNDPVVQIGGPYTINEGGSLDVDASGSTDPDSDSLSFRWDLDNDGTYNETGEPTTASATITWATLQNFGITDDGTYTIGIEVNDGRGGVSTDTVSLTVNNVAPLFTSLSTITVSENQTGALTVAATDPVDTLTYSISGGTDSSRFQIGTTGVLTFLASPNFEAPTDANTDNVYQVEVTVNDGDTTASQTIYVTVDNANEIATSIGLSNTSVSENSAGATVGTVSVSDPDAADIHTLAVDDSRFEIIGTTLKVKDGVSLNHESADSITINVTATDQNGSGIDYAESFSITVVDINESPTDIALSNNSVSENSAGATIGTVSVSDIDDGDSHVWVVSDNRFEIVGSTLRLKAGQSLDHEAGPTIDLDITATDQAGSGIAYNETVTISVSNVNEAPTQITLDSNTVAEEAAGASVGNLGVTDPDAADSHNWAVDDSRFEIVGDELRLKAGQALDADTEPTVTLLVTATDQSGAGLAYNESFTITVSNTNEAPTDIALSNLSVAENADGATIGSVSVTDVDLGDVHSWSVDDARFEIVGGVLRLKSGQALDHESEETVELQVTVTDQNGSGLSYFESFTISVTDSNEAPTDITLDSTTVAEEVAGASVGNLGVVDLDDGDIHSWTVDDSRFEVVGNELRLKAGQALDADTEPTVTLLVTATDQSGAGLAYNESFTITVSNSNEAPTDIALSNLSVAENADGATIGSVSVTDVDPGDVHAWSVDDARFEIVGGVLRIKSGETLDHEADETIDMQVTVTDQNGAGQSYSETFTLSVSDINDAPTDITLNNDSVQGGSAGAIVGAVSVQDQDFGDTHMWSVDDSRFEVVAGILKLAPGQSLDGRAEPSVTVQLTATDASGDAHNETFTIAVQSPIVIPINRPDDSSSGTTSSEERTIEEEPSTDETESESERSTSDESETQDADDSTAQGDDSGSPTAGVKSSDQEQPNSGTSERVLVLGSLTEAAEIESEASGESVIKNLLDQALAGYESSSGEIASSRDDIIATSISGFNYGSTASVSAQINFALMTRPGAMWNELDQQLDNVESQIQGDLIVVGAAGAAASSFTVGAVAWGLRTGFLASGMLAQLPAWRAVDPLLIMQGSGSDNESLEDLMKRRSEDLDHQVDAEPQNATENQAEADRANVSMEDQR